MILYNTISNIAASQFKVDLQNVSSLKTILDKFAIIKLATVYSIFGLLMGTI